MMMMVVMIMTTMITWCAFYGDDDDDDDDDDGGDDYDNDDHLVRLPLHCFNLLQQILCLLPCLAKPVRPDDAAHPHPHPYPHNQHHQLIKVEFSPILITTHHHHHNHLHQLIKAEFNMFLLIIITITNSSRLPILIMELILIITTRSIMY